MKIFFILLPLLFSISFYAQDAELLKRIGARKDRDGNILLGKAFIRKDDRSISFPGRINVREGVIEVLVSTPRGRMHESLIVTELDPFQLQMALVLAGYDNEDITRGAPFHIEIIYGKSRRINVDEWLYDSTAGKPKDDAKKASFRHQLTLTDDDVAAAAFRLLKDNGKLCVCQRPDQLASVIYAMKKHRIEPKVIRFVRQRKNSPHPWLVLVDGRKNGGVSLTVMPDLIMEDEKGGFSREVLKIYDKI